MTFKSFFSSKKVSKLQQIPHPKQSQRELGGISVEMSTQGHQAVAFVLSEGPA